MISFQFPGHWCSYLFRPNANHHGHYFLLDPPLDSSPATIMENQIFSGPNPSLRSLSKLPQKTKCLRFYGAIALPAAASRLLLPTVRGSLLLTPSWGRPLVVEVGGSWYYNRYHHFLRSLQSTENKILEDEILFKSLFYLEVCCSSIGASLISTLLFISCFCIIMT